MKSLEIGDNAALSALPQSIGQLNNLQSLVISGNDALSALPESIGQLNNLQSLGIGSNNALSALPESLKNLDDLETLIISGNGQLQTFPAVIAELPQLKRLDVCGYYGPFGLDRDSITTISPFIGQLTQLDTLNFSALLLEDLPEELENLKGNLKYLDIRYNPMTDEVVEKWRRRLPETEVVFAREK